MTLAAKLTSGTPDSATLKVLAKLAGGVYSSFDAAASQVGAANARQIPVPGTPKTFACDLNGETVVAVSGTVSGYEYLGQVDGWAFPQFWGVVGGEVNSRYLAFATAIYNALPNSVSVITGHSMGGGIAQILGAMYKAAGLPSPIVVTFGCPRPATSTAAASPAWAPTLNIVDPHDVVTLLQPDGVALVSWRRPGQDFDIDDAGNALPIAQTGTTASGIAGVYAVYGSKKHAIGDYVNSLNKSTNGAPQQNALGGSSLPATVYQFAARARMFEQSVTNVFYYSLGGSTVPTDETAFFDIRSQFRSKVLPLVSDEYVVLDWNLARIAGVEALVDGDGNATGRGAIRFAWSGSVPATSGDKGAITTADACPSYTAIGFTKKSGPWYYDDFTTVVPNSKIARGACRFAGIHEDAALAHGDNSNRLKDAIYNSWNTVGEALRKFTVGGVDYRMVLFSMYQKNKLVFDTATPPQPRFFLAEVTGMVTNPYLTTQVSRKASKSNLG